MKNFLRGILVFSLFYGTSQAMSSMHKKVLLKNHAATLVAAAREDKAFLTKLLFFAIINNDEGKIRSLVSRGADIRGLDDNGDSVLHIAWSIDCRDLIPCLLELGANILAKDTFGMTLLHLAVHEGDTQFTDFFLTHKASVVLRDKDGYNPLHRVVMACLSSPKGSDREDVSLKIVAALLNVGKDALLFAADKQGKTVGDYVAKEPESKLSRLLNRFRNDAEEQKRENRGSENLFATANDL